MIIKTLEDMCEWLNSLEEYPANEEISEIIQDNYWVDMQGLNDYDICFDGERLLAIDEDKGLVVIRHQSVLNTVETYTQAMIERHAKELAKIRKECEYLVNISTLLGYKAKKKEDYISGYTYDFLSDEVGKLMAKIPHITFGITSKSMKWGIDIKDIIESNIQDLRLKVSLGIDEARNKTMAELEEVKLKRINKQLNKYKRYEV